MDNLLMAHVHLPPFLKPNFDDWSAYELLLLAALTTALIWYLQFSWGQRRLYKYARNVPGPFAYPLIGSAHHFLGDPYQIFTNITGLYEKYPGIFKVWYGHRLFYAVSDPKYFEICCRTACRKNIGTGTRNQWWDMDFLQRPQANILVEQLTNYAEKGEFDIFHVVSKYSLDTICESTMGVKVNAQTTDSPFPKWVDRIFEIVFLRIFVFWYHFDFIFNMTMLAKDFSCCIENMHRYSEHVSQCIKQLVQCIQSVVREKKIAHEKEMGQLKQKGIQIKKRYDENSQFTEQELTEEVNTFIIAGSDTTASTSSFALVAMGLHQDLQQKVFEEVIDVIGPDRAVEPADLPHLKYTERFVKETLRIFPVAGFVVRAVEEDVDIGDHVLPSGSSVIFGILRAHTNEKYWPDPYKFDPDRFLPEEVAKRHPCTYVPFSYGPRNCIGMKYGMMSIKTLIATVIRRYRIHTSYKRLEDIKLKSNLVLRPKDGYKVSIEVRQ
ncbi:hypothetical protein NQ317_005077 [Molorchus minor]|uniref:Cytochrome P450 n=1 Tax=Molorchus minor TaxID=1323400 RepID=A0ABQ9JWP4_9CUCU|nr:hypothetical protein NQ317_005077 [Molorchus minor]